MSLGLYHVVAPSEARLDLGSVSIETPRCVSGRRRTMRAGMVIKNYFPFSPIFFICMVAVSNVKYLF